jgi:hypothetical protein
MAEGDLLISGSERDRVYLPDADLDLRGRPGCAVA